jgi:uncharacterized protein
MSSTSSALRIPVADLLRRFGATRHVDLDATVADLHTGAAEVPPDVPVHLDATLERIPEGVVTRGTIQAPWRAACSRCVQPVEGDITVHVHELFEPEPLEGETYRLDEDALDLEPLVRDALLLELPAAPLCDPECRGLCPTCGADRNETTCDCTFDELDPRWAALRSLDL